MIRIAARPGSTMITTLTRLTQLALPRTPHRAMTGVAGRWIAFLRRWPDYYRTLWATRTAPPAPRLAQVHLEATNLCNLRCVTCNNPRQSAPTGMMPLGRARQVIDEAWAAVGPRCVVGFYIRGESTLHPELPAMIRYAHARGFRRLLLSSNVAHLDAATAHALLDAGLSELRLSVDGADAARFERIREGARFDEVCANIALLDTIRRPLGSACRFRLHATLDGEGLTTVPAFVRAFGATVEIFKMCLAVNQGGLFDPASAAALSSLRFAASTGWQVPCRPLYDYAGVTWDGKITSCCVDYHDRFVVGRLDDGLQSGFDNAASVALRRAHSDGDLPPECAACGFSNALVDWFEDELNAYVAQHRRALATAAGERRYRRWLARAIAKFDHLDDAAGGPARRRRPLLPVVR